MSNRRSMLNRSTTAHYASVLEKRNLLSANVTAVVSRGGNLTLQGDSNDNKVSIWEDRGYLVLSAFPGNTVNLKDEVRLPLSTVRNITFNGLDGNDFLSVLSLGVSNGSRIFDFKFDGGKGDDALQIIRSQFYGTTEFLGGEGNDAVQDGESSHRKAASYRGGSGEDGIMLISPNMNDVVNIDTGPGDDRVSMYTSGPVRRGVFNQNVNVLTGTGSDSIYVAYTGNFLAGLTIDTGSENDSVQLIDDSTDIVSGGVRSHRFAKVRTGSGNDLVSVSMQNDPFSELAIDTGGENDQVALTNNSFHSKVSVSMGDGTDLLYMDSNVFSSNASLRIDGGSETDTIEGLVPVSLGGIAFWLKSIESLIA